MQPPAPAPQLRPLRIGEILDVAIKVYTRHAKDLFKLVLLLIAPVQVIAAIVLISTTPDASLLNPANTFDPANQELPVIEPQDVWASIAGSLVIALLSVVATLLATAACFHAISSAYLGAPVNWRESLRLATKRLPSLLWLTLLSSLAIGLGFIACILPGIWLWVSFTVAVPALLSEGITGTKAMGRSFSLVQSRWWPTFGAVVIGFIIAIVVTSIFTTIITILLFTDIGESVVATSILSSLANLLGAVLVTPFQAAVAAILYFDLRVRKEGFDIQLLASRIGIGPPTQPGLIPPGYPIHQPPGGWPSPPPPPPPPY